MEAAIRAAGEKPPLIFLLLLLLLLPLPVSLNTRWYDSEVPMYSFLLFKYFSETNAKALLRS